MEKKGVDQDEDSGKLEEVLQQFLNEVSFEVNKARLQPASKDIKFQSTSSTSMSAR